MSFELKTPLDPGYPLLRKVLRLGSQTCLVGTEKAFFCQRIDVVYKKLSLVAGDIQKLVPAIEFPGS